MIYFKSPINKNELSQNCERISNEIDQVIDNTLGRHNSIKILDHTPQILVDVGCPDLPILFSQSHVRNCLHPKGKNPHWHGLQKDTLSRLPFLLSEPAIIYDSLTSEDSIVLVLNEIDDDGLPVIASLTPNGMGQYSFEKLNSNYLTSVYGKDNLTKVLERADEADFILYIDKEKSQELCNLARLLLPWGLHQPDFDIILHKSNNIVNEGYSESTRFSYDYEALLSSGRIISDYIKLLETDEPAEIAHWADYASNKLPLNELKELYKLHKDKYAEEIIGCNIVGRTVFVTSASRSLSGQINFKEICYVKSPTAVRYSPKKIMPNQIMQHLNTYGYKLSDDGKELLNNVNCELFHDKNIPTSIHDRIAEKKSKCEAKATETLTKYVDFIPYKEPDL